ncbi:hypothetical protein [Haladaptatus caseinilyticus]|uniref:hypothetical protein n=1 Tax=Haladaptatus caseinilyticus TaxID=2993314 RepID=UPI00224B2E86|nr:hypothetical protein [Haladaptatus caseinilyticus]
MITVSERLLWGRQEGRVRHWSVFVGGFAGVVFALLFVILFGTGSGARLAYDLLLPAALFYAPPIISALSAFRGGGLLVSLAVGVVPSISFGVVTFIRQITGASSGDVWLPVLVLAFGSLGLIGSVVGFLAGRGVLRFVEG